jgi:hypothetical protein
MNFHHRSLKQCRNRRKKALLKAESSFQFSDAVGASSIHLRRTISPREKVWSCQFQGNLLAKDRRQTKKLSNLVFHCVPNISSYRTAETDLQDKKCTFQYGAVNHIARKALTSTAECVPPPNGATAPSGWGPPHYRRFMITLGYTTLLWASDKPDKETSTGQHTTLTRDTHPGFQRDSKPQSQQVSGRRPTP